jgi:hypothetical protein
VNVTLAGTTGRTFNVPVTVVPFATADIVADLADVAMAVVTVNVAVVAPEASEVRRVVSILVELNLRVVTLYP